MCFTSPKAGRSGSKTGHELPTVIDLFSGAGLFASAFVSEGFQLIEAVEVDRVAAATHRLNLGEHIRVSDVRDLEPSAQCDVLIAGPPCQGFSTLGSRNPDDPRNKLCMEVARWASISKPSIVVIENVAAFLDAPQSRRLARKLKTMGYVVTKSVLNAADYGVPQLRKRSFTIASKLGAIPPPQPTRKRHRTVRDALKGLPLAPDFKNHHGGLPPTPMALERIRLIPEGGDKRHIMKAAPHLVPPSWWKTKCEVTDAWGRMVWDEPCNTIRTEFVHPSKGRYLHPTEDRVITLREASRLHSIPDSWQFVGKPLQVARQIGNSVPPALGRAIARTVFARLAEARS